MTVRKKKIEKERCVNVKKKARPPYAVILTNWSENVGATLLP